MNTPKKCSRCKHADAVISMDCRRCHYIAIVMTQIHKRYEPSALNGLVDLLRGKSLAELIEKCPVNAYRSRAVFSVIRLMAFPGKMDEDALKSSVADQILRDLGEFEGAREYDKKNGDGAYLRDCAGYIGRALKATVTKLEEVKA